jgi:hypothetical protein
MEFCIFFLYAHGVKSMTVCLKKINYVALTKGDDDETRRPSELFDKPIKLKVY